MSHPDKDETRELQYEVERLREQREGLLSVEFENRKEIERLRAWQEEVVRGYEFESADEMLAWVRAALAKDIQPQGISQAEESHRTGRYPARPDEEEA